MVFKRGLLIVSHGLFADGVLGTAEMFVGKVSAVRVQVLGLKPDDAIKDFENNVAVAVSTLLENNEEVVIVTDLLGGSPNNVSLSLFYDSPKVTIITGFNLPLVLEILATIDTEINFDELIVNAQTALFNPKIAVETMEEEEGWL